MTSIATVVVDVSLVIRWVIPGPREPQARRLLAEWIATGTRQVSPALFASELASTALLYVRQNQISEDDAKTAITTVLRIVGIHARDGELAVRALEIARLIGAGRAYDSLYLALAEAEGCDFWTADERLFNAASPRFGWVLGG